MSLEKEIKQKKFKSAHHKALLNILYTSNWISTKAASVLKPYNVSEQQFNVLRILKGQGDNAISVNEIRSRMISKMSNTSRLVEKLKQKELIERIVCEQDRRQVEIKITAKGLTFLEILNKEMSKLNNLDTKISEEEAITLNLILDKIR